MARSGRGTAFARGKTVLDWAKASLWRPIQSNSRGDLCIAQGLPSQTELIRLGNSYWAASAGIQPSILFPNPTSNTPFVLYNGEPSGGKSYIVDTVSWWYESSSGTVQITAIVGHVFSTNPFPFSIFINPPTLNSTILSLSGKGGYGGRGIAHTLRGGAAGDGAPPDEGNQHTIVQSPVCANTSTATFALTKDVYGRYLVPPQGAFGMTLASTVSSISGTGRLFISWHEVQLPLGG